MRGEGEDEDEDEGEGEGEGEDEDAGEGEGEAEGEGEDRRGDGSGWAPYSATSSARRLLCRLPTSHLPTTYHVGGPHTQPRHRPADCCPPKGGVHRRREPTGGFACEQRRPTRQLRFARCCW